ncbi:CHAT domain-containing protein [Actinoplanes sp. KI2]|uniref:CHAT domain-containing protein n=1 Tax=Actinoplanes sp. KI2 TaxID=2983315 RepID=UPI0021D5C82D|nr:CHAT domain-containing protein [Actinoplanes sp. KI2]MCU7729931.1 CHAT domain-containing protein [Actinoplanes sp. KI2]
MTDGASLGDIRAARDELDAVIEEVRKVPGYERFLAAPTFDDVARVTAPVPLVYLAAADPGGLALIVRNGEVTHVPLAGLTAERLRDRARDHLAIYAEYVAEPNAVRDRWDTSLDDLTGWLWDVVMGPVLDELGRAGEVVLVAGGLLGLLPLHAAWTPDGDTPTGRRYVLDTVAVSYAPNARSLEAARQLAAEVTPSRLLAVAEPWPVPAARLPMARGEAMVAAAAFPAAPTVLTGAEATCLSFEWKAPQADVLHLACHGFAELGSPLDSGLLLAGGRVTLRRLMELPLRVRLAVLSACETAMPGTDLPDEVVALPTGLLQAGVAGVVASQWAVPDRATAMLMAEFYGRWWWDRLAPAAALRAAQRWLRDTTNAEKRRHFAAAGERPGWLPPDVADRFLGWLDLVSADKRSHSRIHAWGAFAHVGA